MRSNLDVIAAVLFDRFNEFSFFATAPSLAIPVRLLLLEHEIFLKKMRKLVLIILNVIHDSQFYFCQCHRWKESRYREVVKTICVYCVCELLSVSVCLGIGLGSPLSSLHAA